MNKGAGPILAILAFATVFTGIFLVFGQDYIKEYVDGFNTNDSSQNKNVINNDKNTPNSPSLTPSEQESNTPSSNQQNKTTTILPTETQPPKSNQETNPNPTPIPSPTPTQTSSEEDKPGKSKEVPFVGG